MSTKTTFKRIALVTVAALGFGLLSSVMPASAVATTALNASVGPNGATSLTVVGDTESTNGALVRLDVTSDSATSSVFGLQDGETITATVIAAPTTGRIGSMADTASATGRLNVSDLSLVEVKGQTPGSVLASTTSTSGSTDWKLGATLNNVANIESYTAGASYAAALGLAFDGQLGGYGTQGASSNTPFANMDGRQENTTNNNTVSYYVAIHPRNGSATINQGAYTVQFQLTDSLGVVRGTKTVKIDFVSAASRSDASLTVTTSGTFITGTALTTTDSTSATYVTVQLKNRDGGLVRNNDGDAPSISVKMQESTTSVPVYTDTNTAGSTRLNVSDTGVYGADFGRSTLGVGTLVRGDGIYGVQAAALPYIASATGQAYRIESAYGNAPIQTTALTIYPPNGAGTADVAKTDVLVTATGMSVADSAKISDTVAETYALPTTTKTATLKFWIQKAETATGAAAITVTPTWGGAYGTSMITPAGPAGTVYTTDALGNFSVTVTNNAPVDGASVALKLTGLAAFGAGSATYTITWATPVVSSIAVVDPTESIYVLSGSTNVVTAIVKDQFGNPMKDQVVTVTAANTPSALTPTTVIAPLTSGANGAVTYSYTPPTGALTGALSFKTVPATNTATYTYNYAATLPVVGTMVAYHGLTWGAAATLTPATGIYATGTTRLAIVDARDLSDMSDLSDGSTSNDQIAIRFTGLTAAGVSATGAAVTVTAGAGGHILDALGAPVKSRVYAVNSSGTTPVINVLATGTGAITFTATSGAVTATAAMWVAERKQTDNSETSARFVTVTSAKTGTANGTGVPVTVKVTDRYGNPVSGVDLNVVASGVGSFMGGNITQSFKTDASGSYTFLANTGVSEGGVAKFTATTGTTGSFDSEAGYVGATEVDAALAAGNVSASAEITFAAGASAADIAQAAADAAAEAIDAGNNAYDAANAAGEAADAATAAAEQAGEDAAAAAAAAGEAAVAAAEAAGEAAAEATDAANAATDAANASAEAADAATAAAQDAADAVAALSTQVSEMITALKKQITALTNLVIKIQKKVKA
jgi:hypothetical protein